jgi:predicted secreted protein
MTVGKKVCILRDKEASSLQAEENCLCGMSWELRASVLFLAGERRRAGITSTLSQGWK